MRLVTSVKYLVGFVAASSATILIGGSAFAAEHHATDVLTGSQISVETSQTSTSSTDQPVETSATSESNLSILTNSSLDQQGTGTSLSGANTPVSAVSISIEKSNLPSADAVSASRVSSSSSQTLPASVVPSARQVTEASSEIAGPATSRPAMVSVDESGRTMLYHSQVLPIQPAIVSQTTAVSDLATNLPSAPATTHTPLPAKSTTVLNALTDQLASSLVPHVLDLAPNHSLPSAIVFLLSAIGALAFAMAGVGGIAARIKQSGFVTAARSDVANGHFTFATPPMTGYVTLRLRAHNPFFMVSDTKTFQGISS